MSDPLEAARIKRILAGELRALRALAKAIATIRTDLTQTRGVVLSHEQRIKALEGGLRRPPSDVQPKEPEGPPDA